jgi:hypothetical protein
MTKTQLFLSIFVEPLQSYSRKTKFPQGLMTVAGFLVLCFTTYCPCIYICVLTGTVIPGFWPSGTASGQRSERLWFESCLSQIFLFLFFSFFRVNQWWRIRISYPFQHWDDRRSGIRTKFVNFRGNIPFRGFFFAGKRNVGGCPFARLKLSCAKRAEKIQNPKKWNKLQAKTK